MRPPERTDKEMKYGVELIKELEDSIALTQKCIRERQDRIDNGQTDEDDCFISIRCDDRELQLCKDKIELIKDGGTAWFREYATLDGQLIKARWCNTRFGSSLRAVMPDGSVVWTTASTKKGLAKKGLKMVECKRPALYRFYSSGKGMFGVYTGSYILFPSDFNYATGENAENEPLEIRNAE